jgi:cytochrome oxidase Cu insertion factor (SCO1/SenC/PrrC family)
LSEAPPKPFFKSPYLIGFLIGAVFLTVLPILQRQFLKAPPPIRKLTAWEVPSLGGGAVSSVALAGKVVLATTEFGPCDAACLERQKTFGLAVRHVDDLKDKVVLLSLVGEEAKAGLTELIQAATPAWRFGGGTQAQLEPLLGQLQLALDESERSPAFPLPPGASFSKAQSIVMLDQNGAARGYWINDVAGRGNSIMAARMLAQKGPNP